MGAAALKSSGVAAAPLASRSTAGTRKTCPAGSPIGNFAHIPYETEAKARETTARFALWLSSK